MSVTPPPFQVQQAPPRSGGGNKACIWVAVGLVVCCVVLIGLAAVFFKTMMGTVTPSVGCMATLDGAADALHAYAADHNGKYPAAETWMDDIQPYYEKQVEEFKDAPEFVRGMAPAAADSELGCDWSKGVVTGVSYNSSLAGKVRSDIPNPTTTPLVYEVPTAARNQHAPYTGPPATAPPGAFGNPRDWAIHYVEGDNDFGMDSSGSGISVKSGSGKIEVKGDLHQDEGAGK